MQKFCILPWHWHFRLGPETERAAGLLHQGRRFRPGKGIGLFPVFQLVRHPAGLQVFPPQMASASDPPLEERCLVLGEVGGEGKGAAVFESDSTCHVYLWMGAGGHATPVAFVWERSEERSDHG